MNKKYLIYFWDYQMTSSRLKEILRKNKSETNKIWAVTRILESAPFEEIWKYISLGQLKKIFPKLKLKPSIKKAWERALKAWG